MGHQKATLTTDNMSVTLSVYKESDDDVDYERIIAQVELKTPDGSQYSERKEVEHQGDGVLTALHDLLTTAEDSYTILEDALEDAIEQAEADLNTRMRLDTRELLYEFEQNTQLAV